MSKVRRFNLVGGPGSGKSTVAAYIYSELKLLGVQVELVREVIKEWVYLEQSPKSFDQLYICASQIRQEDIFLRSHEKGIIVSDSSIDMNVSYTKYYKSIYAEDLERIADKVELAYPSYTMFMIRDKSLFTEDGRYHNYEESVELDKWIWQHYMDRGRRILRIRSKERALAYIKYELKLELTVKEHEMISGNI